MDAREAADDTGLDARDDVVLSGLRILELYGASATALTTREIAERAGLSLGRTRQLVDTLTRFRYITQLPDSGRYWPRPFVRAMREAYERSASGMLERLLLLAPEILQRAFSISRDVVVSINVRDGLTLSTVKAWPSSHQRSLSAERLAIPLHQCASGVAWIWAERFEIQVDLLRQINLIGTKPEIAGMFEMFAQLTRDAICARQSVDRPSEWDFAAPVIVSGSVVAVVSCRANVGKDPSILAAIRDALLDAVVSFTDALQPRR